MDGRYDGRAVERMRRAEVRKMGGFEGGDVQNSASLMTDYSATVQDKLIRYCRDRIDVMADGI
jgi:hypothetical protein